MENKYLFVLCPPSSGSTLLWKILQTSPNISAFPKEGSLIVKSLLFTKDRWNPGKIIPWDTVKQKWDEDWDYNKPVLLEKSPPHLVRASQLEGHFPGSYFITMIRNPYAFCESIKRRYGNKKFFFKRFSYFNIAKFWTICARYQISNIKCLKNSIHFSYEELVNDPQQICRQIINFVPELEELNPEKKFKISAKHMKITDLNKRQILCLSDNDLFEINEVINDYPKLLNFFNYEYIGPAKNIKFKKLKRIFIRIRSLNRLPNAIRWQDWKKRPNVGMVKN